MVEPEDEELVADVPVEAVGQARASAAPPPAEDDAPPTALISWAHRANDPGTDDQWRDQVLGLAAGLRSVGGIDVDLDLYHLHDPAVDWSRYGPQQIARRNFVLIAVNAAWHERFDGTNLPTEGAGAVAEADELLGLFSRDQAEFHRKVKLVLLPGATEADVPARLTGVQRYRIEEVTVSQLEDLLRTLHDQPRFVPPPVGRIPALPPETMHAASAITAAVAGTATAVATLSAESQLLAAGEVLRPDRVAVDVALLRSALTQPPPTAAGGERQWAELRQQLEDAQRRLAELEAHQRETLEPPVERLAGLREQLAPGFDRSGRCWATLVLTADPQPTYSSDDPKESPVDRRWRQLQRFLQRVTPIPTMDLNRRGFRRPGRVVLSNDQVGDEHSSRWRLELRHDGSAAAAAIVSAAFQGPAAPELAGSWASDDQRDDEDPVLVRRDLLETWLLTELELLADHARDRLDLGQVHLVASLELPAKVHYPSGPVLPPAVLVVDERRDADGRPIAAVPPPGATVLAPGGVTPLSRQVTVSLAELREPTHLVTVARRLAVDLLEHFGVEQTVVLQPDGTLNAFGAAAADQQTVHQHADQLGLPVDPHSPLDRRRKYDELLAEARSWLCP